MNTTFYIPDCNTDHEPQSYMLFVDDVYAGAMYADDITFCAAWQRGEYKKKMKWGFEYGTEFVVLDGQMVTRAWADAFTGTEEVARKTLAQCHDEIAHNYFVKSNQGAVRFITAKYPTLRNINLG